MKKEHKVLIICGILCLMFIFVIGYAAFQSQLTINGTSNISSNWSIKITDVTSQTVVGGASNESEPIVSDTAVTFKTNLVSPGDSMTYTITVANEGDLDAVLDSIETTDASNPAITFTVDGISENDVLLKQTETTFTVTVTYNPDVTSQPENTVSSLTVKLNYMQNK